MRILSLVAACPLVGCGTLKDYTPDEDVVSDLNAEDGADRGANLDEDGDGVKGRDDCDDDDDEIHPGAPDFCGDDVDADCDGEDCLAWDDGFESGDLAPAWILDGVSDWSVWSSGARNGTYCAVSGALFDSQSSHMGLVVETPAGGAVSFWHQGSTEASFDKLTFSVDGVEVGAWSGIWTWQEDTFIVSPGVHNLRWSYTKDSTQSAGQDTVLIDDVLIEGGNP